MYNRVWAGELRNNHKLETYVEIKSVIATAIYVKCNLSKSKRSLVGQLICGCLGLEIEMGRFTKIPRDKDCANCVKIMLRTPVTSCFTVTNYVMRGCDYSTKYLNYCNMLMIVTS